MTKKEKLIIKIVCLITVLFLGCYWIGLHYYYERVLEERLAKLDRWKDVRQIAYWDPKWIETVLEFERISCLFEQEAKKILSEGLQREEYVIHY